jgi:hypothetical protein
MKSNNIPHIILGIDSNATELQITTAYKKLAKIHHPDKYKGTNIKYAQEQFTLVCDAKNTMLSPEYKNRTIFTNPGVFNPNYNSKRNYQPKASVLCNGTVLMSGGFHPSNMNIDMLRKLQKNMK